jgi:hypothetical protein
MEESVYRTTIVAQWLKEEQTLLQENDSRKPIIQIPKVHTPYTPLIIELPVDIKRLVGCNLQLAHPLTGDCAVIQRGIEFIAPW